MRKWILTFGLLTVVGLTACASSPTDRFADSVQAAKQANRPLTIYQWKYGPIWNRAASGIEPGMYAGLGFINTSDQPIKEVKFKVTAYHDRRPVLDAQGKPVVGTVVATGPIRPGASQLAASSKPIWAYSDSSPFFRAYATYTLTSDSRVPNCVRLSGIQIEFADDTSRVVDTKQAQTYFTPQVNSNCAPLNTTLTRLGEGPALLTPVNLRGG